MERRRVAGPGGPRPGSRSSRRRDVGDEEEAEENVACPGLGVLRGLSSAAVCWAVGGGRQTRGSHFPVRVFEEDRTPGL